MAEKSGGMFSNIFGKDKFSLEKMCSHYKDFEKL